MDQFDLYNSQQNKTHWYIYYIIVFANTCQNKVIFSDDLLLIVGEVSDYRLMGQQFLASFNEQQEFYTRLGLQDKIYCDYTTEKVG